MLVLSLASLLLFCSLGLKFFLLFLSLYLSVFLSLLQSLSLSLRWTFPVEHSCTHDCTWHYRIMQFHWYLSTLDLVHFSIHQITQTNTHKSMHTLNLYDMSKPDSKGLGCVSAG